MSANMLRYQQRAQGFFLHVAKNVSKLVFLAGVGQQPVLATPMLTTTLLEENLNWGAKLVLEFSTTDGKYA